MIELKSLNDKTLVNEVMRMAQGERKHQVELLRYLGELAERRLFLGLGYSSLWDYCRRALKFSESISQQRIVVAKMARKCPQVLEMLGDGRLTLCTAADLAPMLTGENQEHLLNAAAGKSRREIQNLDVARGAKAIERDVIRRVAAAKPVRSVPLALVAHEADPKVAPQTLPANAPALPVRHRVAFTASAEVVAKLEKLQELLGNAPLAEIIEKAVDLLLAKADPAQRQARRQAKVAAPKKIQKTLGEPRRPSPPLRDAAFVAADQRCEFVSAEGVRCAETRYLSIDHIQPYALGGTSTDQRNLRCLCMAHNLYFGRQSFGNIRR